MATLTRAEFRSRLLKCVEQAVAAAQEHIVDPLPGGRAYELAAFKQNGRIISLDDALAYLYVYGSFPRVIDVAVRGLAGDCVLVWLRPSGHQYVTEIDQTFGQPPETAPCKPAGLMGPLANTDHPRLWSRADVIEATPAWAREQR